MGKKGVISIIFMTMGVIFILLAFFSPWYCTQMESSVGGETTASYDSYLTKAVMHGKFQGNPIYQSLSYSDIMNIYDNIEDTPGFEEYKEEYEKLKQTYSIFDNTRYLTISLIITSILSLIGILGFIVRKANKMRKIGIIFGIITFILVIIVVFYFTISINNKSEDQNFSSYIQGLPDNTQGDIQTFGGDFWGSINILGTNMSWGPGIAWYLMIIAGIFGILSSVNTYKTSSYEQNVSMDENQHEEITKTIRCPICNETMVVRGNIGDTVTITCSNCYSKGFYKFL